MSRSTPDCSIMRLSPSSNDTSGNQSDSSWVSAMSGQRIFGLQAGNASCTISELDPVSSLTVSASSSSA
jgi:hypothetical protein